MHTSFQTRMSSTKRRMIASLKAMCAHAVLSMSIERNYMVDLCTDEGYRTGRLTTGKLSENEGRLRVDGRHG